MAGRCPINSCPVVRKPGRPCLFHSPAWWNDDRRPPRGDRLAGVWLPQLMSERPLNIVPSKRPGSPASGVVPNEVGPKYTRGRAHASADREQQAWLARGTTQNPTQPRG